ncbi:hypothetical protein BDY19DRAFT_1064390 [Irpex rosettiformis]|uniref:Uncharacterized protein n=1 Tax=Irpex rosettiformis TaxID=378272 RepID=A0ACB8UG55_9APHY|nr:hypothetical protein BDY19DRAFT_1064390 [Irpex rosettiformis]
MTVYNYVDSVNDNLLCCICRMPFIEPVTTRSCSHTFCRECISTALYLSQCCPIDRSPLTLDDLTPADPLLRNLVDELQVECPMRSAGCSFTGQRQLLDMHSRNDCHYVSVSCLDGLCDDVVLRKNGKHRDHAKGDGSQESPSPPESTKVVNCDGCHSQVMEADLTAHKDSCPDLLVECGQTIHGCSWKGPRRTLSDHLQICPYESIKGFLAVHDQKTSALSEENAVLRHKVTVMDGIIASLRRELSAVKAALGPWFRPDRCAAAGSHSGSSGDHVIHGVSLSRNGDAPGVFDNATFTGHARDGVYSPPVPTGPDDLASYFPEPEPDDWLPADYRSGSHESTTQPASQYPTVSTSQLVPQTTTQASSTNRSTALPHAPYTQTQLSAYTVLPPASPSQSAVAPLDISTSLEGSLLGLRESIVTLSGAVDSLGRRQDIALTAESMRTAEEIRSLRAIIHGLRMQVHSIIVDRNTQVAGHSGEESMLPWLPDPHDGPMPWMRVPFTPRYPLPSMSCTPGSAPKL